MPGAARSPLPTPRTLKRSFPGGGNILRGWQQQQQQLYVGKDALSLLSDLGALWRTASHSCGTGVGGTHEPLNTCGGKTSLEAWCVVTEDEAQLQRIPGIRPEAWIARRPLQRRTRALGAITRVDVSLQELRRRQRCGRSFSSAC